MAFVPIKIICGIDPLYNILCPMLGTLSSSNIVNKPENRKNETLLQSRIEEFFRLADKRYKRKTATIFSMGYLLIGDIQEFI